MQYNPAIRAPKKLFTNFLTCQSASVPESIKGCNQLEHFGTEWLQHGSMILRVF